jgi:hypothetical protein
MISLVEHENHGPTAIHRTFISAEGSGKARIDAQALAVWHEARPADGTIVETYLANRGLALPPPQYLPDKASLGPVAGGAVRLAQARAG